MNLEQEFFAELRAARETRGMTLDQIARTTLIDVKYLQAIEQGNVTVLPATYVRAFIREYAATIGLDPAAVMREFDRAAPQAAQPREFDGTEGPRIDPATDQHRPPLWSRPVVRVTAVAGGVLCFIVVMLYINSSSRAPGVKEIPFSTTVRENEQRLALRDSTKVTVGAPPAAPGDSLMLSVASIDSVWMQLSIDGTPANDYLFPPKVHRHWKAMEKFTITLGNGGGMLFRLNSVDIGTLGKPGSVVRNYELSRRSLTQQQARGTTP